MAVVHTHISEAMLICSVQDTTSGIVIIGATNYGGVSRDPSLPNQDSICFPAGTVDIHRDTKGYTTPAFFRSL